MKNDDNDDNDIIFDRDISAPKNKMNNNIGRNINSNNNFSNNKNSEEEGEEEEEEFEEEKDDKQNIEKEEFKNDFINKDKKEENVESEPPKIIIQLKKETNNNNILNSSCQVNLINSDDNYIAIQELKIKLNNMEKEKQQLIDNFNNERKNYEEKLSKKQQEIMSLTILNNKLKKNLERLSNQVNKLLDKLVEKKTLTMNKSGSSRNISSNNMNLDSKNNNKKINSNLNQNKKKEIFSNEENLGKNNEIESLKEKLIIKESQLKNSLNLIEFLSKDNRKLKLQYNSLIDKENVDEKKSINNYKLIEELKKKNKEILQLEKEYKDVVSLKSPNKELEYFKNQVIQLKEANNSNESKIKKLKSSLERYQDLNKKNVLSPSPNSPKINIKKYKLNCSNDQKSFKISRNNLNNKDKSMSVVNSYDWKRPELNKNFSKLFNETEKKALQTLFENEEDYLKFNQKINAYEKHYSSNEKRYQINLKELKRANENKDEQITFLREKIKENEMKIKILSNQVHIERQKNEKNIKNNKEQT